MIRSLIINRQDERSRMLSVEQVGEAIKGQGNLVWVSLEHPTTEEALAVLQDLFHFHPLAIEDCLNSGYQTPKVDDYGRYIFIIAHAIHSGEDYARVKTMELNIFLGENYIVTLFLDEHMPPVDQLWHQLEKDERLAQNGVDFMCHRLLDYLVDDYMPVLDNLDDEIEWLEDQVLERPSPQLLERILMLKHTLINLRRIMSPQREVLNRLSRDDLRMIGQQTRIYFRDVYDHMVRFQDLIESLRDIVTGAMDIYLNSTSLRLNEIMKALTIVSTIFLPLSFVAGVYGMNFAFMPELTKNWGYPMVWGVFIMIVVGMLGFFKYRGWF
jgi:magnesium transporter